VPGDGTRSVSDVLIGELWLGAGQSNMQITVGASRDGQLSIAEDDCRELRFFDVERNALVTPGDDVNGAWKVCTPDTARSLSAVGCYFARDSPRASRSRDEHLGGTTARVWTPIALAAPSNPAVASSAGSVRGTGRVAAQLPFTLALKDLRFVPRDPGREQTAISLQSVSPVPRSGQAR
jgi:sialate O-acetylesterase